jgi:hypothetical protein
MYSNYGYNTYATDAALAEAGTLAGFALVMAVLGWIIGVAAAVMVIIGLWKIFKKAGKNGWEALIGGHDTFVMLEIAGINPIWCIWVLIAGAASAIPVIGWIAGPAFIIFVWFWLNIKLAKTFGKETGFGVLMAFFPYVMYPILGFGSAKYTKPSKLINKPGEDK